MSKMSLYKWIGLTWVTISSTETKITHTDSIIPEGFAVATPIAVWTLVIEPASQLRVDFFQWVKQIVHPAIVVNISNAARETSEVYLHIADRVFHPTNLKRTKTIQVAVIDKSKTSDKYCFRNAVYVTNMRKLRSKDVISLTTKDPNKKTSQFKHSALNKKESIPTYLKMKAWKISYWLELDLRVCSIDLIPV